MGSIPCRSGWGRRERGKRKWKNSLFSSLRNHRDRHAVVCKWFEARKASPVWEREDGDEEGKDVARRLCHWLVHEHVRAIKVIAPNKYPTLSTRGRGVAHTPRSGLPFIPGRKVTISRRYNALTLLNRRLSDYRRLRASSRMKARISIAPGNAPTSVISRFLS